MDEFFQRYSAALIFVGAVVVLCASPFVRLPLPLVLFAAAIVSFGCFMIWLVYRPIKPEKREVLPTEPSPLDAPPIPVKEWEREMNAYLRSRKFLCLPEHAPVYSILSDALHDVSGVVPREELLRVAFDVMLAAALKLPKVPPPKVGLAEVMPDEDRIAVISAVRKAFRPIQHYLNDSYWETRPHKLNKTTGEFETDQKEFDKGHDKWRELIGPFETLAMQLSDRTPLWHHWTGIWDTFDAAMTPYEFPKALRYQGQFILSPSGTGKTTYMTNLIMDDIHNLVVPGEGSIIVLDTEGELIPKLASLAEFAPGGLLDGRLVYLDANPDYPVAINILDTGDIDRRNLTSQQEQSLERSTLEAVRFFIEGVGGSDNSPNMETVLSHVVGAATTIPGANIYTLQKMMQPESLAELLPKMRIVEEDRQWLRDLHRAFDYKSTVSAIRTRLDTFTRDPQFKLMFRATRSKLDLHDLLKQPHVVLIDANKGVLGTKGAEDFGRFFISKVLQAAEQRILDDEAEKLPVFFYIDEASEYVKNEKSISKLVDKARKQFVGLTIATQREKEISHEVLDALQSVPIQTRLPYPGKAIVTVQGDEVELVVLDTDLKKRDKMSAAQWRIVQDEMHEWYCTDNRVTVPTEELTPEPEPAPEPEDDDEIKPM